MSDMSDLYNTDWWAPEGAPLRQLERFRLLYEQASRVEKCRTDYFFRDSRLNAERLQSEAREMAELLGELTTPKLGRRPKKRRRDTA